MRSFFNRFILPMFFRRVTFALLALAWIGLVTSCHRNDVGYEFRAAAAKGDITKVQTLLKTKPNLVFTKNQTGATALHWAALYDHKDIAALLLANKAER